METGDLVFVRENGPIARLIRFFDKGRFNHVAIAVDSERILEAQYNTRVQVIPNPYTDYEVVHLKLGDDSRINEFVCMNLGKRYDYLEILRIWVRLVFGITYFNKFNTAKEVICSELAGEYLEFVKLIDNTDEELSTPNELYRDIKGKGY